MGRVITQEAWQEENVILNGGCVHNRARDSRIIAPNEFPILINLIHSTYGKLIKRFGINLYSDDNDELNSRLYGLFRFYNSVNSFSLAFDTKTSVMRLLYKKDDKVNDSGNWTELDASIFAAVDEVYVAKMNEILFASNGNNNMIYFKDETDYGQAGCFNPHKIGTIGTPVFAETPDEVFTECGLFQYRYRFAYDEEENLSNPGPATPVYPYQWVWKDGLKALTLSALSVGNEFVASTKSRIVKTIIERRYKKYDDEIFSPWYRVAVLSNLPTSYTDSYSNPTKILDENFDLPPAAKCMTSYLNHNFLFNLKMQAAKIPYVQSDSYIPYTHLKRSKIIITNNSDRAVTDAVVEITLQWGDSSAVQYIAYDDTLTNAGKDFLFTEIDGITPLNCYIIPGSYSAVTNTATFLVRIPEIIALEIKEIYVYYNGPNVGADTATNWKNVLHRMYIETVHKFLQNIDSDDIDVLEGEEYISHLKDKVLLDTITLGTDLRRASDNTPAPDGAPWYGNNTLKYSADEDDFLEFKSISSGSEIFGIDIANFTDSFTIEFWLKWDESLQPSSDDSKYIIIMHKQMNIAIYDLYFYLQRTTGSLDIIGVYLKANEDKYIQIDTTGLYDVFNGDWWKIQLTYNGGIIYHLRAKSIHFEYETEEHYNAITTPSALSGFYYGGAISFKGYLDELSFMNRNKSKSEFDSDFLRITHYETSPTIDTDDPEDVNERESEYDGLMWSLKNNGHVYPAENLLNTGGAEGMGLIPFRNSIYLFERNRVYEMNISANYKDWQILEETLYGEIQKYGLASRRGLCMAYLGGAEMMCWLSNRGVMGYDGQRLLELSEPVRDIFTDMNQNQLSKCTLAYSPKHKQLWLGIPERYHKGAGETTRNVQTNNSALSYVAGCSKGFCTGADGTEYMLVLDIDAVTSKPTRKIYKRTDGGTSWSLVTTMPISTYTEKAEAYENRFASMCMDNDKSDIYVVTVVKNNTYSDYHVIYNSYNIIGNTWGTEVVLSGYQITSPITHVDIDCDSNNNLAFIISTPSNYVYIYRSNAGIYYISYFPSPGDYDWCSVRFDSEDKVIILFNSYVGVTRLYLKDINTNLANTVISNILYCNIFLDSDNWIHLAGLGDDGINYLQAHYYEEHVWQFSVGQPEVAYSSTAITEKDFGFFVRNVAGRLIPTVYVNIGEDLFEISKFYEFWAINSTAKYDGTDILAIYAHNVPLPGNTVDAVSFVGLMDNTGILQVRCWQATTYVLKDADTENQYYVDTVWVLDLNEENFKEGMKWTKFLTNYGDGLFPFGIPCVWDENIDNQELLFASSASADVFVYGERYDKKYMDEISSGNNLIIPINLQTKKFFRKNAIFAEPTIIYDDFVGRRSLVCDVFIDDRLIHSYNNVRSNMFMNLPLQKTGQSLQIMVKEHSLAGLIELFHYSHSYLDVNKIG